MAEKVMIKQDLKMAVFWCHTAFVRVFVELLVVSSITYNWLVMTKPQYGRKSDDRTKCGVTVDCLRSSPYLELFRVLPAAKPGPRCELILSDVLQAWQGQAEKARRRDPRGAILHFLTQRQTRRIRTE